MCYGRPERARHPGARPARRGTVFLAGRLAERTAPMKSPTWLKALCDRISGHPVRRPLRRAGLLRLESLEDRSLPAAHLVTSNLDDGSPGTLRWAVGLANAASDHDDIVFDTG